MVYFPSIASFALLAATAVVGNPGAAPTSSVGIAQSSRLHQTARRSLAACQDTLSRRDKMEKSATRRAALVDHLRKKRGLVTRAPYKRALSSNNVLSTTHLPRSSEAELNMERDQESSYVRGEYVRSTISEEQPGIYTYVDLELIDVSTCETAPDLYIDFWHCNSTGVYSGILGSGNGDSSDVSNVDKTFLRGIQPTNEEGHASFETIFPGHYSGRATHFDTVVHSQGTVFDNGTFTAPSVHYIGQIFFDQDLVSIVEATSPYSTNTIEITTNSVDEVFVLGIGSIVLEYVYLGDDISDGLLVWGVIGVDMGATYEITPAATLTEHGGVIHYPSSIGGGNMTGDFPSGAGSDNSTSSGGDVISGFPSGTGSDNSTSSGNNTTSDSGDESGESTSSSDNSTITLLHGDLLCNCTSY
ncbi:Intradiol ring-cleavage dioxygenase-like protein [Desarmillaria tabescens]|uniref:Intradiol ring-cleavage dioxygenase-like protein n=1 Tax=Armillaria tabescens TaxID=1929756 RepID=A0AA39N6F5_ARMTA|nr:Intradiol ring-cleavage dioxygenase-like protein [Desarmillaria tabescens]KAK0459169.1 Intradiol ring-cleavage dioxygenase-like protein [Desarmillaria tabescens]